MANMGLGNNVNALNDIKQAIRLEPDNVQYQMVLQQMEGGGNWYQEKGRKYEGKVGKQMERIPVQIDYVLRENALDEKVYERVVHPEKELDYDYAAGEERVA